MRPLRKAPITLPAKLAYAALQVAVAGSFACTTEAQPIADAASDSTSATDTGLGGALDAANPDTPEAIADAALDAAAEAVATQDSPMGLDGPTDAVDDCSIAMSIRCDPSGLVDGAACPGFLCSPQDCPVDAGCIILT